MIKNEINKSSITPSKYYDPLTDKIKYVGYD
jgi:hypothetical protein